MYAIELTCTRLVPLNGLCKDIPMKNVSNEAKTLSLKVMNPVLL